MLGPRDEVLANRVRKTLAEQDGELVGSLFPGPLRQLPIFFNLAQNQEQPFGRCFVTAEVTTILRYFLCRICQSLAPSVCSVHKPSIFLPPSARAPRATA